VKVNSGIQSIVGTKLPALFVHGREAKGCEGNEEVGVVKLAGGIVVVSTAP
jgi:hypothetical protein